MHSVCSNCKQAFEAFRNELHSIDYSLKVQAIPYKLSVNSFHLQVYQGGIGSYALLVMLLTHLQVSLKFDSLYLFLLIKNGFSSRCGVSIFF